MTIFGFHNKIIEDKREELVRKGAQHDEVEREIANFEKEMVENEKNHVGRLLNLIPNMYLAMIKKSVMTTKDAEYYSNGYTYNRGTSQREIDSYRVSKNISNPLSATSEEFRSNSHFLMFANEPQNSKEPVRLKVHISKDVPHICMEEFNGEKEVLISPFTNIEAISDYGEFEYFGGKLRNYEISLKPAELKLLSNEESEKLKEEIINETEDISHRMSNIYNLKKEIKQLEQKIEIFTRRQKNFDIEKDEYDYYEEQKSSAFKKIGICDKEIKTNFIAIKSWKNKAISYTMSESKKKELEFEVQITKREEIIEKQKEESSKKLERLKAVSNSLEHENIKVKGVTNFEDILGINEMIRAGIKKLDFLPRDTEISKYRTAIDNLNNTLNNELFLRNGVSEENLVELERITKNGSLGMEIQELSIYDQNYLKQRVFDSFKYIVENKEVGTLKRELDELTEKDKKKGLARFFNGPKKVEKQKMVEIRNFLENYHTSNEKGDKVYSVRNIVAEMEIFVEDYSLNSEYSDTVKRVNELKQILNDTFTYSESDVEKIKMKKRDSVGNKDSKIVRITRLYNEEKEAMQIKEKPKCPMILKLMQIDSRIRNRNPNYERNNTYEHDN